MNLILLLILNISLCVSGLQAISAEEIWNKSVLKGKQVVKTVQNSRKAQIAVGLLLIAIVLRALLKKDKQIASGETQSGQQPLKANDAPEEQSRVQDETRAKDTDEADLEEELNLVSGANGNSRVRSEPTVSYSGAGEALHDADDTGLNYPYPYPSDDALKREAAKDVAYEQLRRLEE